MMLLLDMMLILKTIFSMFSESNQINSDTIIIESLRLQKLKKYYKYYNIKETIKTRTNDNVNFRDIEGVEGFTSFEGRLLVYEKKTAGGMLKDHGAGVNII